MHARLFACAAIVAVAFTGAALADEPLKSGPQVGARNNRGGFHPRHVTGRAAGEHVCPG